MHATNRHDAKGTSPNNIQPHHNAGMYFGTAPRQQHTHTPCLEGPCALNEMSVKP